MAFGLEHWNVGQVYRWRRMVGLLAQSDTGPWRFSLSDMYKSVVILIIKGGTTHNGPGRGWMECEFKRLILTKEGRYNDLERVAGVG